MEWQNVINKLIVVWLKKIHRYAKNNWPKRAIAYDHKLNKFYWLLFRSWWFEDSSTIDHTIFICEENTSSLSKIPRQN